MVYAKVFLGWCLRVSLACFQCVEFIQTELIETSGVISDGIGGVITVHEVQELSI